MSIEVDGQKITPSERIVKNVFRTVVRFVYHDGIGGDMVTQRDVDRWCAVTKAQGIDPTLNGLYARFADELAGGGATKQALLWAFQNPEDFELIPEVAELVEHHGIVRG